jgi:hypothetical protein
MSIRREHRGGAGLLGPERELPSELLVRLRIPARAPRGVVGEDGRLGRAQFEAEDVEVLPPAVRVRRRIERTRPSSRSLIFAFHESTYLPTRGSGQWIRYRSTYSTPRRARDCSKEARVSS